MKRIIFAALFFVFTLTLFAPIALAQTPSQNNPYPARTNPDVPQNLATHTQSVMIETLVAVSCMLTGIDPVNPTGKCLGVDPGTRKIGYVSGNGGLIGWTGSMIAGSFVIPISTSDYVGRLASNFGVAKKTLAAAGQDNTEGYGFASLRPVIGIWEAFRNVVYILFVLIFLFIGLGIMFRFKIDQRTVMNIQNQIPKAVVILVLITFSYAMVGILVDLMYLLIYVTFSIFSSIEGFNLAKINPTTIYGNSPFQALGALGGITGLADGASASLGDIIGSLFNGTMGHWVGAILSGLVGAIIGGAFGPWGLLVAIPTTIGGGIAGDHLISLLGQIVAYLIFAIAITIALFRLWITLLKSFVYILIATIFAPLWIGGSLIPGSPLKFGSWFRFLLSYLLVFPATVFMLLTAYVIKTNFERFDGYSSTIVPPILGLGGHSSLASGGPLLAADKAFVPPLIGNPGDISNFGSLIAFIIILMTPEVVQIVKDALKAPNITYTKSIGAALGGGKAVAAGFAGGMASRLYRTDNQGNPKGAVATFAARRFGGLAGYLTKHGNPQAFKEVKDAAKIENIIARKNDPKSGKLGKLDSLKLKRHTDRETKFANHFYANASNPDAQMSGHDLTKNPWERRQYQDWAKTNKPTLDSSGRTRTYLEDQKLIDPPKSTSSRTQPDSQSGPGKTIDHGSQGSEPTGENLDRYASESERIALEEAYKDLEDAKTTLANPVLIEGATKTAATAKKIAAEAKILSIHNAIRARRVA